MASALCLGGPALAADPANQVLPAHFDQLLAPSELLSNSAPAGDPAQLSLLKRIEEDDLHITGFVASRNGQEATDYRLYLGLRYQTELGDFARLTSRAFYGTGTYDGSGSATGGALPADVLASNSVPGNWVGADWKVESQLSAHHAFSANVEYREAVLADPLDLSALTGHTAAAGTAQPERKVAVVTNNAISLASDLALSVRMRYDQDTSVEPGAVQPRVELVYRPESTATVSAVFDQSQNAALSATRAYTPWASEDSSSDRIRNYELGYKKSLSTQDRLKLSAYRYDVDGLIAETSTADGLAASAGARIGTTGVEIGMEHSSSSGASGRVSYAWQETADWLSGTAGATLGEHLAKVNLDIPIVPKRLLTSIELQYVGLVGPLIGDRDRDFVIGNLTLASGPLSGDTRISFGMHNLFGARDTSMGTQLAALVPPDGRSVRLDVSRKL